MVLNKKFLFPLYIFLISACLVLVALRYTSIFIGAYGESRYFCGPWADGSLEHLYPLRRIAAGQIAGHDFQVFHGLALPYLHYPFYVLLGENLFASEMTRNFFPPIFFFLTNFLFFWSVTRKKGFALILSTVILLLAQRFYVNVLSSEAYVSLGVRTAFPILVAATIIWLESKRQAGWKILAVFPLFNLLVTFLLALTFLFAAEQGIAALVAFPIALFLFSEVKERWQRIKITLTTILLSIGQVFVVFFVVSGKYFLEPLRYYLIEIPADEFWFYGTMTPSHTALAGILKSPYILGVIIVWALLVITLIILKYKRRIDNSLGIFFLLIYGLLTLGHLLDTSDSGRVTPLARVEALVVAWIILKLFPGIQRFVQDRFISLKTLIISVCLGVLGLLFFLISSEVSMISKSMADLKNRQSDSYLKTRVSGVYFCDSGYINWKLHLDTLAKYIPQLENSYLPGPVPTLWSTFAGIPEYLLGQFNPSSDYMDFALGPTRRRKYFETFEEKRPDYVVTIRRQPYPEEWLEDNYWNFYRTVLANYEPVDASMFGTIWQKNKSDWVEEKSQWDGLITNLDNEKEVTLAVNKQYADKDLLDVQVFYEIRNPWMKLPILGLLPKYILNIENYRFNTISILNLPISLAPYEIEKEFPIVLAAGVNPRLRLETVSDLPGVSFSVKEIKYRVLKLSETKKRYFLDL